MTDEAASNAPDGAAPPAGRAAEEELRVRLAEMEARARRAEDRAAWLQQIAVSLRDVHRFEELVDHLARQIAGVMSAETACVYVYEPATDELRTLRQVGDIAREARVRPGQGIVGWVAATGKSLNVKDATRDPRYNAATDAIFGVEPRSLLCQPLREKGGRIAGIVQVINRNGGYFGVEDEVLLSAVSTSVSVVFENRKLFLDALDRAYELGRAQRALEQRVRQLDSLYELHRRINHAESVDQVLGAIATIAATSIPSRGVVVSLLQAGQITEFAWQSNGQGYEASSPWSSALRESVLHEGAPAVNNQIRRFQDTAVHLAIAEGAAPPVGRPAAPDQPAIVNACAVPLVTDASLFGVIELVNRIGEGSANEADGSYSSEDLRLLELIGAQVSQIVHRTLIRQRTEWSERLSAIGGMLSGVVHDLRTPLTIANGYVQLMARADEREVRRDYQQRIQLQFEHINQMTQELLRYARGDSQLYRRTVQLYRFADEVREWLEFEFKGRGIELDVRAIYRGTARIDEGKVKRLLFNLARNAREAMPQGGRYAVVFEREGDRLVIECTDTGPGIPQAIRGRLFDMFVSEGKAGGTGLGLSIVKKVVDDHEGTIRFACGESGGTTFRIELPLAADPNELSTPGFLAFAGDDDATLPPGSRSGRGATT